MLDFLGTIIRNEWIFLSVTIMVKCERGCRSKLDVTIRYGIRYIVNMKWVILFSITSPDSHPMPVSQWNMPHKECDMRIGPNTCVWVWSREQKIDIACDFKRKQFVALHWNQFVELHSNFYFCQLHSNSLFCQFCVLSCLWLLQLGDEPEYRYPDCIFCKGT